jgi:general secretion pathway protein J
MSRPAQHAQAGFSLIEAMVATALLAMIATTSVVIFTSFFNGRSGEQELSAISEDTLRMRKLLGEDLAHAIIRPHGPDNDVHLFSGDAANNCFLSFARHNAPKGQSSAASDIESILYCLRNQKLLRFAYYEADATPDTKRRRYVVINGVKDVKVRFYDREDWQDEWLMGVEDGRFFGQYGRLPALVEVKWTPTGDAKRNQAIRQVFALPPEAF